MRAPSRLLGADQTDRFLRHEVLGPEPYDVPPLDLAGSTRSGRVAWTRDEGKLRIVR